MSRVEFEFSRAPRLFKLIQTFLAPYVRDNTNGLSWRAALQIVCEIRDVVQLTRRYDFKARKIRLEMQKGVNRSYRWPYDTLTDLCRVIMEEKVQTILGKELLSHSQSDAAQPLRATAPNCKALDEGHDRFIESFLDPLCQHIDKHSPEDLYS